MTTSTYFDDTAATRTAAPHDTSLKLVLLQGLSLLRGRRERIRAQNRLRWELSQYSDRELADMGLCRSDIEDVVQNRFAR